MERLFFVVLMVLVTFSLSYSQVINDTIRKEGGKYYYNKNPKSAGELKVLMKSYPGAYTEISKAKVYSTLFFTSTTLGCLSGAVALGHAFADKKVPVYLVFSTSVLLFASIPLNYGYQLKADKAVRIFNNKVKHTTSIRSGIEFGLLETGLGIRYKF